jgi:hypothetical protein
MVIITPKPINAVNQSSTILDNSHGVLVLIAYQRRDE